MSNLVPVEFPPWAKGCRVWTFEVTVSIIRVLGRMSFVYPRDRCPHYLPSAPKADFATDLILSVLIPTKPLAPLLETKTCFSGKSFNMRDQFHKRAKTDEYIFFYRTHHSHRPRMGFDHVFASNLSWPRQLPEAKQAEAP